MPQEMAMDAEGYSKARVLQQVSPVRTRARERRCSRDGVSAHRPGETLIVKDQLDGLIRIRGMSMALPRRTDLAAGSPRRNGLARALALLVALVVLFVSLNAEAKKKKGGKKH